MLLIYDTKNKINVYTFIHIYFKCKTEILNKLDRSINHYY